MLKKKRASLYRFIVKRARSFTFQKKGFESRNEFEN